MKSDIDRFGRTRGTGGDTAELPHADLAAAMEHAAAAKPRRMSAARPPEGAHTGAEGAPVSPAAVRPGPGWSDGCRARPAPPPARRAGWPPRYARARPQAGSPASCRHAARAWPP